MARKRMIDPSIWTDDGMADLTPRQQLLYIGLFSNADDDGRLKGSPVSISLMMPTVYSPKDRGELAEDLASVLSVMSQVVRYTVDGREYLAFRNFRQWQRIDKPTDSILPPPPDNPDQTTPKQAQTPPDSPTPPRTLVEESAIDPGEVPPNRREEKVEEGKGTEPNARNRAPVDDSHPFALLESLCDVLGQDASVLSKTEKGKQLAVAKRLVEQGVTPRDVEMMTLWLKSQAWVTGGIDLFFLERQLGKWQLAGKPIAVPASLTVHPGGRGSQKVGRDGLTDEERGWREDPGPKGWSADEMARKSMAYERMERSGT